MTQQSWGSPQWGANPQQPSWGAQPGAWPRPAGQPWPAQLAAPPGAYQQPQPYYPAPGGYPPPKRSGGLRKVIVAAIAVIVVIGFIGTVWSFMSDTTGKAVPDPSRTSAPAPTKTSAAAPTKAPATTAPPSKPTTPPAKPTTPPAQVPPPDTNPPDLPVPRTYDEATAWMKENKIYTQSITVPVDCAVDRINAVTASDAALEKHLNAMAACLWRVWTPPMVAAGFQLPRPPVTVYSTIINTACGKMKTEDLINAFYCAADQHIYYGKKIYTPLPTNLRTAPFQPDVVLAHEFGHGIQGRTGVLLAAAYWQGRGTTTKEESDIYSRRKEAQADCFAGQFVASVAAANKLTATDLENVGKMIYSIGDDVLTGDPNFIADHGTGKSRQGWFTAGRSNNQLTTCNSFSVPASKVH